jgi:shikimate kinase
MFEKNITFIGMPGAGKSTVGVVVAKLLCMTFIDTDLLIQNKQKKRLSKIMKLLKTLKMSSPTAKKH